MSTVVMILAAVLTPLLLGGAFLFGRRWRNREIQRPLMSAVTCQHFDIFQDGEFNEIAVERAKRRFRILFERGDEFGVEASLRPGMQFVYQIRALAEIGTDTARRIIERQLQRRLSDNTIEQAWYWIDLAAGLRIVNRQESLLPLLRCSEDARESPLGHFFAAETVCILGFAGYLRQPESASGKAALRLLHRAVEGLRFGVQPILILEARLGEIVETAWDHRPAGAASLHVRIVHETLRLLRRAPHLRAVLGEESPSDQESLDWQLDRIASLEGSFREFLKKTPDRLLGRVGTVHGEEAAELLQGLCDLRVDAAAELLPLARRSSCENRDLMIDVLCWSRDPRAGLWMRDFARTQVNLEKRASRRLQGEPPRRPSIADEIPYRNILQSLRGHPSVDTEKLLIQAAEDWDPIYRVAALGSLGWWEPFLGTDVRECLTRHRRDPSPEVRQTARAALARLGERASLHWFRQALLADDPHKIAEAAHVVADEGLTLLWPDLDRLLDHEHPGVALHAREAVERLAEEMDLSRSCSF